MPDIAFIEALIGRLMLPVALVFNPVMLVRLCLPAHDRGRLPAGAALASLVLNTALPVILHLAGIPLAPLPLASAQATMAMVGLVSLRALRRPWLPESGDWPLHCAAVGLVAAVLIFPFTALGGIDAYKWGDLATSVAVEQKIAWLVHPLSLFGFTPRSYPSLHPLLMGGLRAMGGLGIHTAFYLASLVLVWVGLAGAAYLATGMGLAKRERVLFTAGYVLSPVFIRYVHWGTGRGAFLAVLPFFVGALAALPRRGAWGMSLGSALLLLLSHKTGLVAVGLLPVLRLVSPCFPNRFRVGTGLLMGALALSVSLAPVYGLPSPLGTLAGWGFQALARFGWFLPAIITALLITRRCFTQPVPGFLRLGLIVTVVPAFHAEMYPAMLALPFVTLAAVNAARALAAWRPARAEIIFRAVLVLTVCGAIAIVGRRSLGATPGRIYRAAMFIESVDPWGPFSIESDRWRSRIQGLVTGCPRFTVTAHDGPIRLAAPPPLHGRPRELVRSWTSYLRGLLSIETTTDWYGSPQRRYVVTDGPHRPPPDGARIYDREGVVIYRIDRGEQP